MNTHNPRIEIRRMALGLMFAAVCCAQPVALRGITHVAFRIADLQCVGRVLPELWASKQAFRFDDAGSPRWTS
jgi:hypothetical protein